MLQLDNIAQKGKLSFGLVFPIESYTGSIAKMENQEQLATRAEELGFKSLWFRDIPFHDPKFGDAGQLYDPWVYMTHIMNHTHHIALATGSIILPLRHPVHTAKSIFSLQVLSKGRLIIGTASGDRALEYPAFNQNLENRADLFRDSFFYIKALQDDFPSYESKYYGSTHGSVDLLPKYKSKIPMLITGHSGQSLDWIATHGDGWLYYPRGSYLLNINLENWNIALETNKQPWKPYMQSLYIDLTEDRDISPTPIHLGFKSGLNYALDHLKALESQGVNHVVFNLKLSSRPVAEVIEELGEGILPHFGFKMKQFG